MATRLRLANKSQSTTVDLLSGTLKLVDGSWRTRTAPVEGRYRHVPYGAQPDFAHYGIVVETMGLHGADSVANLVAGANAIEELLENARLFHADPLLSESIWLEVNADGESERRALLYEGSLQYPTEVGTSHLLETQKLKAIQALTRHPLWESTSFTEISGSNLSCWGGGWQWSGAGTIPGIVPARLDAALFQGHSGGGGPLYRVWAGIREKYLGTSGFISIWELEDGTNATDASDVVDGTASGGTKVQVSFATQTSLVKRCSIKVENVYSSNIDHVGGRYLVLGRVKVSSDECAIQLRSGYTGTSAPVPGELHYITNTSWRLIPLGEVQIPPEGRLIVASGLDKFEIQIWAELVGGSGALDLDALCFIPSGHICTLVGAAIQYVGADFRPAWVTVFEDDTTRAMSYQAGTPSIDLDLSLRDWYLPVGDGMLVVAAERETSHDLTDDLDIRLQYFSRWLSYRGT